LGQEGVLQYLRKDAALRVKPFFLIFSLVNPHDVLFYPGQFGASGYDPSMLEGDIQVPSTVNESLITKPRAQAEYRSRLRATGNLAVGPEEQTKYV